MGLDDIHKIVIVSENVSCDDAIEYLRCILPSEADRLHSDFDDIPPPNFDSFEYQLTKAPTNASLKAWTKLNEVERRLSTAQWAMRRTVPSTGEHRMFAKDAIGAFFYAFEATIQVLKKEVEVRKIIKNFDDYIKKLPNYTIPVKGIRTLRTFAVHIDDILCDDGIRVSVVKGHGGTISRHWRVPFLSKEHIRSLDYSKLSENELDAWNKLRDNWINAVLESALKDLYQIVADVEKKVSI